MEFAPDGSLYLLDWHNVLVGHMQHSARDPLRDHVHGRVYRITHSTRPLVKPAEDPRRVEIADSDREPEASLKIAHALPDAARAASAPH